MAVVFEQINSEGLAQLSYIVGDDKAGVAAVIDPRRDTDVYIERAARLGVRITHTVETPIHADFVSRARANLPRGRARLFAAENRTITHLICSN